MENRNWVELPIKDVAVKLTSGGTPSTKKSEYYENGDIPWLNTKEVDYNRITSTEKYITEEGLKNSSAKWIEENSVIVAMYGATAAKTAITKIPLTTNQACCNIIVNHEVCDYEFLFYNISNKYSELENIAVGAAQQNLSVGVIGNFILKFPPLPEQKAIASVLSSLDDKIDLLHQQNQTLESLAETLYLNFIDEREFNSKLSDIFSLQNGYAFKSKSFKESGTIRVIKIKNISGDIVDITNSDFVDDESIKKLDFKFKINSGDILIAMTGAEVGKLGIVPETDQSLWLNQRVGLLKEKFEGAKYLAYLHLKSDFGQDYIENTATGSAQPNISGEGIENCEFPLYEETELREICNKLSPLYDKVIFNLGQIHTLTQMRDTLLPKLMSGEVRVKM